MSNYVYAQVAEVIQMQFAAGDISLAEGREVMAALADALYTEGWEPEQIRVLLKLPEFDGWPMILGPLRELLG